MIPGQNFFILSAGTPRVLSDAIVLFSKSVVPQTRKRVSADLSVFFKMSSWPILEERTALANEHLGAAAAEDRLRNSSRETFQNPAMSRHLPHGC